MPLPLLLFSLLLPFGLLANGMLYLPFPISEAFAFPLLELGEMFKSGKRAFINS